MIVNQIKSQFINKNRAPHLKSKDIFNIQYRQKAFSPIFQIFEDSRNISLSRGNQSLKLYKTSFLGD